MRYFAEPVFAVLPSHTLDSAAPPASDKEVFRFIQTFTSSRLAQYNPWPRVCLSLLPDRYGGRAVCLTQTRRVFAYWKTVACRCRFHILISSLALTSGLSLYAPATPACATLSNTSDTIDSVKRGGESVRQNDHISQPASFASQVDFLLFSAC